MNYYDDTSAISKSGLDKIQISPLDYWWHYLKPDRDPYEPDKKTLFDNALRCAICTPKLFAEKYVKQPAINRSTNLGKSEFAALVRATEFNNQILISATDYDNILKMVREVRDNKTGAIIFGSGSVGIGSRYHEANTGAAVKFIPHWLHDGIIVHISSTDDATSANFSKEAANFKLHKKAAIQIDGGAGASMVFLQVENKVPFKCAFHYLEDRAVQFGRETYVRNCETYVSCMESGIWPGLPAKITAADLPDWFYKK